MKLYMSFLLLILVSSVSFGQVNNYNGTIKQKGEFRNNFKTGK